MIMRGQSNRWPAVFAVVALIASLVLSGAPTASGQGVGAVELDVALTAFGVLGGGEGCEDALADFLAGEPIDETPLIVGESGWVTYCFIITNNDSEPVVDWLLEIDSAGGQASGPPFAGDLDPGASIVLAADPVGPLTVGSPHVAATVTSNDPTQTFTATDTADLDVRRVPVSVGDYVVPNVGDAFDIVFELDATDISAGAATAELTYDPAIIELAGDGVDPVCTLIDAEELLCQRIDDDTLSIGGAILTSDGWNGPAAVLSVAFVAVGEGSADLRLEDVRVDRPGFMLPESFRGFAVDGSVEVEAPARTWYPDLDGDTFGDAAATAVTAPEQPGEGFVEDNSDCNDADQAISPVAIEVLSNDVDENCDGELSGDGIVVGDVSCNGALSILDAVLIAQYEVGIRAGLQTCPTDVSAGMFLPAGDLNGNGTASVADAVIIAQCIVGIDNGFCPEA